MKAAIFGAKGQMGRVLAALFKEVSPETELMLLDLNFVEDPSSDVPPDVMIDFSHKNALPEVLKLGQQFNTPLVLATTGYDEADRALIKVASETLPIFNSSNMSIGVYVLKELVKQAAALIGDDADIEIIEKHHRKKKDAPSGTAIILLDAIKTVDDKHYPQFGRSGQGLRTDEEVGIHAIRGGTIVGEHSVIFCMNGETVELTHKGESKNLFARGAISAAREIIGKPNGLYGMDDLMKWRELS
jgi:4-hydroxy-tetrahydrodipicolinate reductase